MRLPAPPRPALRTRRLVRTGPRVQQEVRRSRGLAAALATLLLAAAPAAAAAQAGTPSVSGPDGTGGEGATALAVAPPPSPTDAPSYTNPLRLELGDGLLAEQCADPDIVRSQDPADPAWYLFCTRDALSPELTEPDGSLTFSNIPTYRSTDLVTWTFLSEALPTTPEWVGDGDMWAPDVAFVDGRYVLYFTATATAQAGGGSAIGAATSDSLAGPWVDSGGPVVEPMAPAGGSPDDRRWIFDPEVLTVGDSSYVYFGSYHGGVSVRSLSPDGLRSDPASQVQVVIPNRYEGTHIVERDGWFYLLGSATNCCAGPSTGYAVLAGRSRSPFGPFVDRTGASLLAGRVGGTPVLHQNGNRWIGTGHHTVVDDFDGQQWIVYHAVDRDQPYMEGASAYTRRPALMDPLDWVDGWPVVRGGRGPSDEPVPGPAAQPGQTTAYAVDPVQPLIPGPVMEDLSDDFAGTTLASRWTWSRPPLEGSVRVDDGLTWATQPSDLTGDPDDPTAVLTQPAPDGDFLVDVELSTTLPAEGCCQNYVQAGLVVTTGDGSFVKLVTASIWETRQTEFARRTTDLAPDAPVYGNTVGGPVGERTHLRLVRTHSDTEALFTAFTSIDGDRWDEAGTWALPLGGSPSIGLVSMGGAGFEATFHAVTVRTLASDPAPTEPTAPTDPSVPSPPAPTPPTTDRPVPPVTGEPVAGSGPDVGAAPSGPAVGGILPGESRAGSPDGGALAVTGGAHLDLLLWAAALTSLGLGLVVLRRVRSRP
ncbi:family 43 glycosylhydrolase [Sanguibacter suaedae]|uniref:Family 43 glycosylhydrolase n=1 Tax=Sanguibacter suaedae TaxID=2795737 RepID=A0A934M987_9MICO|nr:family 43 glycosylhydrolase [Sanguibacter suaedae]MBI9114340.1 family 43 glycosylhydrolase [Sanguibacter suaedae]